MDGMMNLISREVSTIFKLQEFGSMRVMRLTRHNKIDFIMLKHDPENICHQNAFLWP